MSELRQRKPVASTEKPKPATITEKSNPRDKPTELRKRKNDEKPRKKTSASDDLENKVKSFVLREWEWASAEAHEFFLPIFDLVIPGFSELLYHAKLAHSCVRNPLYFACWFPTLLLLGIGKSLHALIGQGSQIRDDEKPAEKEARVAWIYMNDATYFFSALMDLWQLLTDVALWHFDGALGCLIGLIIYVSIILGNIAFFESMRNRSTVRVRQAITANAGFALALSFALGFAGYKKGFGMLRWSWFMRAVSVFFQLLCLDTYRKLWSIYPEAKAAKMWKRKSKVTGSNEYYHAIQQAFPGVLVAALTAFGFWVDAAAVWEALG